MAFVTGTANSLSDLLSAIQNACTDNGWTLSAGGVLSKGTCYTEVKISGTLITIRAGTGVDGSGNLTGACNTVTATLAFSVAITSGSTLSWTWPATYFIHISSGPDEVYVVVNYASTAYQTAGFGQSRAVLSNGATGNWYFGTVAKSYYAMSSAGNVYGSSNGYSFGAFLNGAGTTAPYGVDHRLSGTTSWAVSGAHYDWASLFFRQPNAWNSESIFIPIRVYAPQPSGFLAPVLECAAARFINIANLSDQQIVSAGNDRWRIYPFWRRGKPWASTNGTGGTDTGVGGFAIRYDGP